ncbi:hypothetical protein CONCODRAFT_6928, partial [Conidiobolus coronatus NRRL 28638]
MTSFKVLTFLLLSFAIARPAEETEQAELEGAAGEEAENWRGGWGNGWNNGWNNHGHNGWNGGYGNNWGGNYYRRQYGGWGHNFG